MADHLARHPQAWVGVLACVGMAFAIRPVLLRIAPSQVVSASFYREPTAHDSLRTDFEGHTGPFEEFGLDPWGNRWTSRGEPDGPGGSRSVQYSIGPNGVDERGRGDDVDLDRESTLALALGWAREGFLLLAIVIVWYLVILAVGPRRRSLRAEVGLVVLVASLPAVLCIGGVYWVMTHTYTWVLEHVDGLLLLPLPVSACASLVFICLLGAVFVRTRSPLGEGSNTEETPSGVRRGRRLRLCMGALVLGAVLALAPSVEERDPTFQDLPVKLEEATHLGRSVAEWETALRQRQSSSVVLRQRAALALGEVQFRTRPALRALVEGLQDPDPMVRQYVALSLARFGQSAAPAVPALCRLGFEDPLSRVEVVIALGSIRSKKAVKSLGRALSDQNATVRRVAALSLGQLGPRARDAVPELLEQAVDGGDERLWLLAPLALKHIDPTLKTEQLSQALQDPWVRTVVVTSQDDWERLKANVILRELLDQGSLVDREAKTRLLLAMGDPGRRALARGLTSKMAHRVIIVRSLGTLGTYASQSPIPVPALGSTGPSVARSLVQILKMSGPLRTKIATLKKKEHSDRLEEEIMGLEGELSMCQALREPVHEVLELLGPDAKAAVQFLTLSLREGDPLDRMLAARVLRGMGASAELSPEIQLQVKGVLSEEEAPGAGSTPPGK